MALAGPSFEIHESVDDDGAARVTLVGELDIAVADGVEERLRRLREAGRRVRLDLSQLDFIDSSGVRAIVLGIKHARQGGHEFEVDRQISPTVRRMIDIMGIAPQLWPEG
ncbi:MAG TPA: STAS domain-containing protein [Solirubrobacteraceae bacterium]|nr:STAS domain-containing protein [Solirubrobacteraceae bacterium]